MEGDTNWLDASRSAGADCAIAWEGEPWLHLAADWARAFYTDLSLTMDADSACYDASWYAWQVNPMPYGILTYQVAGNVTIAPTRFGQ